MRNIVSDPSTKQFKSKVSVGDSELPNDAGLGLFTEKRVKEGTTLMLYKGYRVKKSRGYRNKEKIDLYSMGNADGKYVYCAINPDTNVMKSVAGYINDPLDDSLCNVKAVWRGKVCNIVAVRDIEEGEELYMAYGEDYWCQDKWSIRIIYKAWDNYATRRTQHKWQQVLQDRRNQEITDDSDPDDSSSEDEGERGVVSRTPTSDRLAWNQLDFSHSDLSTQIAAMFAEEEDYHPVTPLAVLPEGCDMVKTITECA